MRNLPEELAFNFMIPSFGLLTHPKTGHVEVLIYQR